MVGVENVLSLSFFFLFSCFFFIMFIMESILHDWNKFSLTKKEAEYIILDKKQFSF